MRIAGSPDKAARGVPWRSILAGNVMFVGVVSLFTDLSSEMISPLLPAFVTGLVGAGMAPVYLGLAEGLGEAVSSLLKLVSGRLSDRLRVRKALVVSGYALSSLSRPAMALAGAGWHVVALKFTDRIGKGVRTTPRDALIADSVDQQWRATAFSFHRAMDHTGAVLGPLAAGGLLYILVGAALWAPLAGSAASHDTHALRFVFAFSLVPAVLAMLALIRVHEIAPPAPDQAAGDPPGSAIATAGVMTQDQRRRLRIFITASAIFTLGNSSDMFILLLGQVRFHLSLGALLVLWLALHVAKIAFSFVGGVLGDRYGRSRLVIAGWLVYAAVYAGLAMIAHLWQFLALFVVYGAYYGLSEGAGNALVAGLAPASARGQAFGMYHSVTGFAALPASLIFGLFWLQLGYANAFAIGACLALVATLLLWRARYGQPPV